MCKVWTKSFCSLSYNCLLLETSYTFDTIPGVTVCQSRGLTYYWGWRPNPQGRLRRKWPGWPKPTRASTRFVRRPTPTKSCGIRLAALLWILSFNFYFSFLNPEGVVLRTRSFQPLLILLRSVAGLCATLRKWLGARVIKTWRAPAIIMANVYTTRVEIPTKQ